MRRWTIRVLKPALGRLKTHFALGRAACRRSAIGDFEGLREAGRAIRDYAITHLDTLLETFERASSRAAARCIGRATRRKRARSMLGILRDAGAKTVTKGKSMVTEEIALNPFLEANGIDAGRNRSRRIHHPASQRTAEPHHRAGVPSAQRTGRRDLPRRAHRRSIRHARSTSARRWSPKRARCCARDFEARRCRHHRREFPERRRRRGRHRHQRRQWRSDAASAATHIVVTGIEKVVRRLDDVAVLLRLLTRSATGPADLVLCQRHVGPARRERSRRAGEFPCRAASTMAARKLIGTEAQDVLRCIRCSACLNHCPIYGAIGGHAYGATYPGPIGAALNPGLIGVSRSASSSPTPRPSAGAARKSAR